MPEHGWLFAEELRAIFSCNHTRLQIFGDIRAEYTEAIDRRHLWTQLVGDTRKARWGMTCGRPFNGGYYVYTYTVLGFTSFP